MSGALVVLVVAVLLLPALRAVRVIPCSWTEALSPLWAGFLIVVWSFLISWLLTSTKLGVVIWLPLVIGMIAGVVAYVDDLPADDDPAS